MVQFGDRSRNSITKIYISHFRDMICLLQPKCNFLHGFFKCKLPIEVVDVEVKITSMQGTHIFRRDWTMQVIKCTPWCTRPHPHPTIIKMMKTFLEVEGKKVPTPAPASQFRPPLPNTSPNIRKDNAAEKRKKAVPKRFRPAAPKPTTTCPPLPEAPPKPKNDVSDSRPVPVHESTPWPGAGKVSGNLFEDRNWLLPPNYLDNDKDNKIKNEPKIVTGVRSPRPPIKEEELRWMTKKNVVGNQIALFVNPRRKWKRTSHSSRRHHQICKNHRPQKPNTLNLNMTRAKQQWEAEMERLNKKYNLNCFSDSELDSESDKGEQYCYEYGYKTLIWKYLWISQINFCKNIIFKNLLTIFPGYKWTTKILILGIVVNRCIDCTHIHI